MQQQHEIQINLPGLLRMLGENIYAEPDVAIREMIQNAHDTCIIRGTQDRSFKNSRIDITFERAEQTITIADNGAGMTEKELKKNLSTIGESFTRLQKEELHGKDAHEAALLIGQFGIGLLSSFSISRRVEIVTRSFQKDAAFLWICKGDIHYTVEPCTKAEPGTRVVLHLLDSKLELLDETRLRQAIKKYADFLSIPIFLNGNQANACTPPWETKGTDFDLAEYIQARWSLFPLGIIPFDSARMQTDVPVPRISGMLFIPMIPSELARNFGELDVYISRMFIKANDKNLLPRWASFIKGIINTPDLTPTLSRGEIINDEAYHRVRTLFGAIIINYLDDLQAQDPEKLTLLVGVYNNTIKVHALEDNKFFDRICNLVRMNTDRGYITLNEYLEKSKGVIYYFAESGSGTQHKVLFAHKGLPVIDASWGVEEEFLEKYAERKGTKIERLAADCGTIFQVPATVDDKWHALERDFYRRVRQEAKAVEFEPETVPAVLMDRPLDKSDKQFADMDAIGASVGIRADAIKQMFQQLEKNKNRRAAGEDSILHLNTKNPLVRQLRDMPRNETFYLALTCIFNNAMMFAHHYVSPDNAEVIFQSNSAAFSAMIANAQALAREQEERAKVEIERDRLKRQLPDTQLTGYRSCFATAQPESLIKSDGILIVTVTKTETLAILETFSRPPGKEQCRRVIGDRTYYDLGVCGGAQVFMVQSEMGAATPGGALLTVGRAIRELHPQAVIMCGIAFGLDQDKQQLGDILIAKQIQYYEFQKTDLSRGRISRGDRTTASERLLDRFRSGDNLWRGKAKTCFGLVLSGEKLVNDPGFRDSLLQEEPEAIGGEMEGAGLYAAARDAGVDWILVKAICDWADGDKSDDAQSLAAHNAAQFVFHVLQLGAWEIPGQSKLSDPHTDNITQRKAKKAEESPTKSFVSSSEAESGTEQLCCFFAFDCHTDENFQLLKWLQDYFQRKNFDIKILAPSDETVDLNILRDIDRQIKSAHFGIVELSNNNLDVLYDAGIMHGMGKPLILMRQRNSQANVPFNVFSDYRVEYEVSKRGIDFRFTWLEEELDNAMHTILRMLPGFDNVPKRDGKET
ncbi:MAG: hypothetical protein GY862_08080 [Gammaproteobacteria bacterium]|nr:hypothetical protein [Gammaproteobacteria bacterium]